MDHGERLICRSREVIEGGKGVKFDIDLNGQDVSGFVVRFGGKVYGYINQCAHIPLALDWVEGEFFDLSRSFLICATHGACYAPDSGYCVSGPCKGKRLKKLAIEERGHKIYLLN